MSLTDPRPQLEDLEPHALHEGNLLFHQLSDRFRSEFHALFLLRLLPICVPRSMAVVTSGI